MPLPPFHLGLGLAAKAVGGRYFSFMVFGLTQVMIDLESLHYLLRHEYPVHRVAHTLVGATLIGVLAATLGKAACQVCLDGWGKIRGFAARRRLPSRRISWAAAVNGAGFGVYSHIVLDSIMHNDIRPFAPFSQANPLLHGLTQAQLHLFCTLAGIVGLMVLAVGWIWNLWMLDD